MKTWVRRGILACALAVLGGLTTADAQGPFTAQIQAFYQFLMTAPQTVSGTWTFTNIVINGTCTGCSGGSAPINATYLTQTANSTLTNEQAIGALSSGILRVATTTGVVTSLGDTLPLVNGGTAAALVDPNADRVMFWDDSAGSVAWLTMGTNLTITGTTLDAASAGGDVVGPSSSVDNSIVRFDGTTGKLVQGYTSGAPTVGDTGVLAATSASLTTPSLVGAADKGIIYSASSVMTAAAANQLTYNPSDATYGTPVLWFSNKIGDAVTFVMGSRSDSTFEIAYSSAASRIFTRGAADLLLGSTAIGQYVEINSPASFGIKLSPAAGADVSINNGAHLVSTGTAPALTSGFGTGETISGTDLGGKITVGSGGDTAGVITFNRAWTAAPACWVQDETTSNIMRPTTTTTTLTITGVMIASDVLAYGCSK